MTENTPPTLTAVPDESDIADFEQMVAEQDAGPHRVLLETWREVLKPAETEALKKVTPSNAVRIVQQYPQIKVQEMETFHKEYFAGLQQLRDILHMEIESDPRCLTYESVEDDRDLNGYHYKNLLLLWQQAIQQWELDWDCTDPNAHIGIAVISEVHKMFFSQTGIVAHLDQIGFQFSEDDVAELQSILEEQREGES